MTINTLDRRSTPDLVDLVNIMRQGRIRSVTHVHVDGLDSPFLSVHHNDNTREIQARVDMGHSGHRITLDWMR